MNTILYDQKVFDNIYMLTLTGSRAYGFATKSSDWDYWGIYILPIRNILSIDGYKESFHVADKTHNQEYTLHEIGKVFRMLLTGNPSVVEAFHGPLISRISYGEIADIIVRLRGNVGVGRGICGEWLIPRYITYIKSMFKDCESDRSLERLRKDLAHVVRRIYICQYIIKENKVLVEIKDSDQRQHIIDIMNCDNKDKYKNYLAEAHSMADDLYGNPISEHIIAPKELLEDTLFTIRQIMLEKHSNDVRRI